MQSRCTGLRTSGTHDVHEDKRNGPLQKRGTGEQTETTPTVPFYAMPERPLRLLRERHTHCSPNSEAQIDG